MTTDTETSTTVATTQRVLRIKTAADAPPPLAAKTATKSDTVIRLLLRAKGATPMELIAATDWQPHSLRAFLSGLRKKDRDVVREERKAGGFAYRIAAATTAVGPTTVPDDDAGPRYTPDDTASPGSAA